MPASFILRPLAPPPCPRRTPLICCCPHVALSPAPCDSTGPADDVGRSPTSPAVLKPVCKGPLPWKGTYPQVLALGLGIFGGIRRSTTEAFFKKDSGVTKINCTESLVTAMYSDGEGVGVRSGGHVVGGWQAFRFTQVLTLTRGEPETSQQNAGRPVQPTAASGVGGRAMCLSR